MLIINILICLLLFVVGVQDYKDREVSLWVFITLGVLAFFKICLYGYSVIYLEILMNIGMLLIQLLLLYFYFNVLRKKNVSAMIGLGDIIFFVIIALSFSLVNFMMFQVLSLIVALFFSVIARIKNKEFIPLAGIQAFCLMLVIGIDIILEINLFATYFI